LFRVGGAGPVEIIKAHPGHCKAARMYKASATGRGVEPMSELHPPGDRPCWWRCGDMLSDRRPGSKNHSGQLVFLI
jgi:hypothetical protein